MFRTPRCFHTLEAHWNRTDHGKGTHYIKLGSNDDAGSVQDLEEGRFFRRSPGNFELKEPLSRPTLPPAGNHRQVSKRRQEEH